MRPRQKPRAILAGLLGVLGFACGGSDNGGVEPPPAATNIAINGGHNQSAAPGASVPLPPSVKVTDASTNPVADVQVTFAVASGGGSLTNATQRTNADGIATVGSWTLGPTPGANTLTATSAGLTGSPVTFMASAIQTPAVSFETLVTGFDHTCGLTAGGNAYCWGWNEFGQVGDGTTTDRTSPMLVSGDLRFQTLSAAGAHTCGVASDGVSYCWGRNADGELGDGSTMQRTSPTLVSGGLTFQSLVGGFFHTCGVTPAGAAYCWGRNLNGQLGDGTSDQRLSPTAVSGTLTFQSLAGGGYHTCGVVGDGAAHCWGNSFYGQMGNGEFAFNTFSPVPVGGGLTFRSLSAGSAHNCGLTADDLVYCWGFNSNGQVGDGSTDDRSLPVEIGSGLNLQSVALGNGQSCGVTTQAIAYCWGWNATGQVGDGTTTDRLGPVKVSGELAFRSLSTGAGNHSCGVTSNLISYCWGDNAKGAVGDATTIHRLTPVRVAEVAADELQS
jgi:alpha-tubulin suppressor-like RCC1 family protein